MPYFVLPSPVSFSAFLMLTCTLMVGPPGAAAAYRLLVQRYRQLSCAQLRLGISECIRAPGGVWKNYLGSGCKIQREYIEISVYILLRRILSQLHRQAASYHRLSDRETDDKCPPRGLISRPKHLPFIAASQNSLANKRFILLGPPPWRA